MAWGSLVLGWFRIAFHFCCVSPREDRCCFLSFISRGAGRCGGLDVECVGMCEKNKVEKKECEE